jgi:hypothetical protein
MKRIFLALTVGLALFTSSCLKDKDYEDQKYGITPNGIKGVGFLKSSYVVAVGGISGSQAVSAVTVALNADSKPDKNIGYTAVGDPTVVPATVGGVVVTPLPAVNYSVIPGGFIPAGEFTGAFKFNIIDANNLDLTKLYGVGFTLTSAEDGYLIGANSKSFYMTISIKNPYSGTYTLTAGSRYNCSATGDQNWAPQAGWAYPAALVIPANYGAAAIPTTKDAETLNATTIKIYVANLGAGTDRDYSISVTNPTATANVNVDLTPSFAGGISNIRWSQKTYDPVNKRFILLWTYNNQPGGVGNDRIIYEVLTKQ